MAGQWKEVEMRLDDFVLLMVMVWRNAESGSSPHEGRATVAGLPNTCQDSRTPRRRFGQSSTTRRLSEQGSLSCFYCFNVAEVCLVERESSGKALALVNLYAGTWSQEPTTSAACALLCKQKCQRM
jgi:hypothetical protein